MVSLVCGNRLSYSTNLQHSQLHLWIIIVWERKDTRTWAYEQVWLELGLLAWKAELFGVLMTVMSCLYVFIPHLMLLLSWTCVVWSKPRLVARRIRAHPAWIPHEVDHDLGNLSNASTVEGTEEIEYVPPLEIVRRPKSPKAMIPTGFNTGMCLLFFKTFPL